MKYKLAIGSDHGGYELKKEVSNHLVKLGYELTDVGTYSLTSCNYPDFAFKVGEEVASKRADYGIIICTSGEGVAICCNKVKGIRCGIAYNDEVAKLMREHNDCNIIALGAKYTTTEEAINRIETFLNTPFLQGRHAVRVDMIKEYEDNEENI